MLQEWIKSQISFCRVIREFSGVELSAITIGINNLELVSVKATKLVVCSKTYQRLRSAVLPHLLSLRAISLPVREKKTYLSSPEFAYFYHM